MRHLIAALVLTLGVQSAPLAAQATFDRNIPPTPGPTPTIHVPSWTTTTLANGARLVVSEKHDLPLVAVAIDFIGGEDNYQPAGKVGVANFTSQMLSEGTTTRTADQLSEAQQMLGTSIFSGIGGEEGSIQFTSLTSSFEPALTLMADMMLNSTFPAEALERIRGRTLVALRQARDRPNSIASDVFRKVVYGDDHPYGRVMTDSTVNAIDRDDIIAFHDQYYQPGRAIITVTGDVHPAEVKAAIEKAFAAWKPGGSPPTWQYPPVPAPKPTTIYLVDKPHSAQSVFAIGLAGPSRSTPDYYAIDVMNTLLGGLFQSRLNHNIREVKGYSYGVFSSFAFGHGPGPFRAGGGVMTAKTDSALIEFMREFRGVEGAIPFTDDEIQQGKQSLIQSLPRRFASVNGIGASIADIYTEGLPETYFQDFPNKINAVTRDDLVRVARKYIDLDHLNIVIVGDRSVVEDPLKATGIAPIVLLDVDGKPVSMQ
jgi:zinc protease